MLSRCGNSARVQRPGRIEEGGKYRAAMITLTYRPGVEWEPGHVKTLLDHYRKWFKRRGFVFRAVWKLETTAAGIPHYHIVTWIPAGKENRPPLPDKQGWWPHGQTQAVFAYSPVGYIAKYAAKEAQSRLPKGARIWGYCGLDAQGKFEVARALAPRWLKKIVPPSAQLRRVTIHLQELRKRGQTAVVKLAGFLDLVTGFRYASPWLAEKFDGIGMPCRHQGYVDCWSSDGDHFQIPQGT